MTIKAQQLNALFYPFADVMNSDALLLSALWFDNIYILEPNFFHRPSQTPNIVDSDDSIRDLVILGIVKPIGPELLGLGTYWPAITDKDNVEAIHASLQRDMNDAQLQQLVKDRGYVFWEIPNAQYLFWNGLGLLLEVSKHTASGMTFRVDQGQVGRYKNIMTNQGYDAAVESSSLARRRLRGGDCVEVPFLQAESLMTTVALLACSEMNLVPVTDDPLHHQFLIHKLQNNSVTNTVREVRQQLSGSLKRVNLAMKSVHIYMPLVSDLTTETVLEIRHRCSEPLRRFRMHIAKLTHSIQAEPWDGHLDDEVTRILEVDILPAVQELQDRWASLNRGLVPKVLDGAIKLSPIPLIGAVATGLPLGWLLAASAGAVALRELVEWQVKRRELQSNGLCFLLDLQSRAR